MRHFSLRSQNSEYPRIFQVMQTNQNVLSTDLVNTSLNKIISIIFVINQRLISYYH